MGCKATKSVANIRGSSNGCGNGEDIRDHYKIGGLLGSGAFGQVRECRSRATNEIFAVKIMERRGRDRGHWSNEAMFRREVALLGLLTHANIVEHIDFYEDNHFLYAVMERCFGGELFDQILRCKRFLENDASYLCRQMLHALRYCHSQGIVHRDIKAENFLFKTADIASDLKLIDFGMSARLTKHNGGMLAEVCGSPHYLSPELIKRRYNTKADLWALGVLIYLMLFGRYPFDSHSTDAIIKQILHGQIHWNPGHVTVSPEALNFMQCLLERDPDKRLSAEQALEHPWIKNCETPEEWKARKQIEEQQLLNTAGKAGADLLSRVKRAQRRVSRGRRRRSSSKHDSRRNLLLQRIERDWLSGKTTGVRVSPVGRQGGCRPEYVRRDVRHNSAPGRPPGSSLADLQALRLHIEQQNNNEGYKKKCNNTSTIDVADITIVNSKHSGATTSAGSENNDYLGVNYDWQGAEDYLREKNLAQNDMLDFEGPRRAITVSVNQKEVLLGIQEALK